MYVNQEQHLHVVIVSSYNITKSVSVQDVAKFINQLKRDDENSRTVKDIEDRWVNERSL